MLSSFLGLKAVSYLGQRNTFELTIYIKNNDYIYQCNGVKFQWDVKVLASFIFEEFAVGGEIPRELHKLIVLQISTHGAKSVNHVKVHGFIIIIIYIIN